MDEMFEIGDYVWVAKLVRENRQEPCPVCYGHKYVILILGNDDQVELSCEYCRRGWQEPTGFIEVGYFVYVDPEYKQIDGVDIRTSFGELKVTYWFGKGGVSNGAHPEDVASTREEAIAKGAVKLNASNARIAENETNKAKEHKSYSWNAGYHLREAERCRKDMEQHQRRASIMKSKSKDKE